MIIGIGIDIVDLNRIRNIHKKYGERFLRRILAPEEFRTNTSMPVSYIGSRFAAKEAAAKALGTGFINGITPSQIVVQNNQFGKPLLIMNGAAHSEAETKGVRQIHLSLSHEKDCAIAVVILED